MDCGISAAGAVLYYLDMTNMNSWDTSPRSPVSTNRPVSYWIASSVTLKSWIPFTKEDVQPWQTSSIAPSPRWAHALRRYCMPLKKPADANERLDVSGMFGIYETERWNWNHWRPRTRCPQDRRRPHLPERNGSTKNCVTSHQTVEKNNAYLPVTKSLPNGRNNWMIAKH